MDHRPSRPMLAALVGGLSAGLADLIGACLAYQLPPGTILQAIARGWYGAAAFEGGLRTITVGAVSHLLISVAAAAVYVAASRRFGVLLGRPILCGAAFGLATFCVMRFVVLPLSAVGSNGITGMTPALIGDIAANLLFGVIIALVARWLAMPNTQAERGSAAG